MVRENLLLAVLLLVLTGVAGYWTVIAFGLRQVLTVVTALVILVGIWLLARDLDRKIARGDFDAD